MMDKGEASSPIRFLKPFEVFHSRKRDKPVITIDDFSPLKCLQESPRRASQAASSSLASSSSTSSSLPRIFPQLTSPSRGQDESPVSKKRRLALTPVKTSQTPSPAKTKVIKRQLNFGGLFSSPKKTPEAENKTTTPPKTGPSSLRRNSKGSAKDKKKGPTTPAITTLFKPLKSKTYDDDCLCLEGAPAQNRSVSSVQEIKSLVRTPIDWSLKTRIRFVSRNKPFPFKGCFRASENATGISSFVRCVNNKNDSGHPVSGVGLEDSLSQSTFSPSQSLSRIDLDTSSTAILRQQTLVWMHPHLPWMPLYPRTGISLGASSASPSLPLSVTEVLCKDFTQSLMSVFHLLKTRQCAFFYVCAPTFTVLFRAAGVGGMVDVLHAMITPTSRGFRNLLEEGHVLFNQLETESEEDISKDSKSNVADEGQKDEDNDPNLFLETLGLSQQDFPSLSSFPRGQRSAMKGDASLILVSGPDTQSLVNVLNENVSKIAVSKTGPLAGIPPTILSPTAFAGSTLRPLKIKVSKDKLMDGSLIHILDVQGPILPTNVYNLCETFRSNQAICPFDVTLVNLEATNPFTKVCKALNNKATPASVFMTQSLTDSGLSEQLIADLCSNELQAKKPLRQLRLHSDSVSGAL